jgi:hypothetical protein
MTTSVCPGSLLVKILPELFFKWIGPQPHQSLQPRALADEVNSYICTSVRLRTLRPPSFQDRGSSRLYHHLRLPLLLLFYVLWLASFQPCRRAVMFLPSNPAATLRSRRPAATGSGRRLASVSSTRSGEMSKSVQCAAELAIESTLLTGQRSRLTACCAVLASVDPG